MDLEKRSLSTESLESISLNKHRPSSEESALSAVRAELSRFKTVAAVFIGCFIVLAIALGVIVAGLAHGTYDHNSGLSNCSPVFGDAAVPAIFAPVTKRRVCPLPSPVEARDDHNEVQIRKERGSFMKRGLHNGWLYGVVVVPVVVSILVVASCCERRSKGG